MKSMLIAYAVPALVGALLAASAFGQLANNSPAITTADPLAKEVQAAYARVKVNILKAADKMPAADYGFSPATDTRTFAQVVSHVVEAQTRACGSLNQAKLNNANAVPPESADKANIVEALKESFAECDKSYAAVTDANMTEMFQGGPAKRSRLGFLWGNVAHDNEQYATLAIYLRLKGQVPPSSEK